MCVSGRVPKTVVVDLSHVPPGSIAVGIDGSPWSDRALEWAVDQAALEQRPLTIVHAITAMGTQSRGLSASSGLDFAQLLADARADGQELLDAAAAEALRRRPELVLHDVLCVSDPRSALLGLAHEAAMLVVGSRGRGPVASLLLGSVSVSLASHAPCPIVIMRPGSTTTSERRMLVGVDGTRHSLAAIEFAYRTASFRQCALTVLHSSWTPGLEASPSPEEPWPDLSADRALVSESLAGMAEKFPDVEVTVQMVSGPAAHHLIAASSNHDLVVVGHQRINQLSELIHDSVAPTVLEHAGGAVAVVPSPALPPPRPTDV